MIADLKARADRLRELHHAGEMLVLPNVWDAASAKIVAEAGFPVVATASAANHHGLCRMPLCQHRPLTTGVARTAG